MVIRNLRLRWRELMLGVVIRAASMKPTSEGLSGPAVRYRSKTLLRHLERWQVPIST